MWQVGKGRLKLKVEQCRDDTPEAITDLIRQCTEYDRTLRPKFAPEVGQSICFSRTEGVKFSHRSTILYQNLNLFFHVYNVLNRSLV